MAIRPTLAALAALTLLTAPALAAKKPAEPVEATALREAGEPIMAVVSIKSQRVTFYDAEGWILRAPVSTGTTGRETPAGVFAVIEKDKDHHSSMYDDAWMPNMQRITWNGIALHGGPLPGYAASHGCVRMPFPFAEKLFDRTRLGMRVIISPLDAEHSEPVDISHPVLFQPKADAIAAAPARAETAAREAADAAKDADDTKKLAATTAREAAPVTAALKKLEWQKKSTEAEVAYADKLIANAKTNYARAKAEDLKAKAAPKAEQAATALEAAKADAKTKLDAAAAAKDAAKAAVTKKTETAKVALDAKLALEPVSVYISRSTQKLYVRRNTHKPAPDGGGEVFDTSIEVPVTIRDAGRPIGTHIFTAMAKTDSGLRWSAVTIDGGDDAKDALDRVSIPEERARPHRADRAGALLDRHLRRAALQGDQLSHRVRRGPEQPAAGRLHHAQADAAGYADRQRQLLERKPDLRRFFQPRSAAATRQCAAARRPVLLSGWAAGLYQQQQPPPTFYRRQGW